MRKRLKTRLQLNTIQTLLLLFLFGGLLTAVSLILLPTATSASLAHFVRNPILILLNGLPIWLVMGFLFFASRNFFVACVPPTLFIFIISFINRNKVFFRDEPLLPADIFLLQEVRYITVGMELRLGWTLAALLILFILLIAALAFVKPRKLMWKVSIPAACACVLVFGVLLPTVYWNHDYYGRHPVRGSPYRLVDLHNSRGSVYSFIAFTSRFSVQRPPNFSEQRARDILARYAVADEPRDSGHVNVVLVLGESFSLLSDNPVFLHEHDPLESWHQLAERGVSGEIIVPNFAGGTANTEFDVLTGLFTQYIRESPSSFWYIRQPFASVVSVLVERGYHAAAMHPGMPWFYNRQNVYRNLGFHRQYFVEDFFAAGADRDVRFVTDADAFAFLRGVIESRGDAPLLAYLVTIQNHLPYADRFHTGTAGLTSTADFSDAELNEWSNYFRGMQDAADELLALAEFLDEQPEPFVLVFFSDHLPAFAGGMSMYERLDYDFSAQPELQFTVPFLIYANEAAQPYVSLDGVLPLMSANYLGQTLLEILGFERDTAWFSFLTEHREIYPVLHRGSDAVEFRVLQYYFLRWR
ncbi:MAG: LTA synthase family protein [Oscillospiraceae bacterium]|nr:LTA synthase family protein [Oscillospiraceae bacterium]